MAINQFRISFLFQRRGSWLRSFEIPFFFILSLITFLIVFESQGQIQLRGSATTATSTNSSLTISRPTGVVAGDVLIVNIGYYCDCSNNVSASSGGWELLAGTDLSRGRASLLYKIAGTSEPSTYTFNVTSGTDYVSGAMVAFSGVDNGSPFVVTPSTSWTTTGGPSISNVPSINTDTPNTAILIFGNATRFASTAGSNFSSWTLTNPSTLTELYDIGNNQSNSSAVGAAWGIKQTPGSTGNGEFTRATTSTRTIGGIMIALRPRRTTTTTTLSSSSNTINFDGTTTLTATVSPNTASGTVEFFDGTTSIGTATLTGAASKTAILKLNAEQVSAGARTITAQYLGNGSHSPSVSNELSLTVIKITETITTPGNSSFTVPAGITFLVVEAWGGGGGGFHGSSSGGGKGGGGGGYAKSVIANPSSSYEVIVGAGGNEDSNGSPSIFGSNLVVAAGGFGGTSPTNGGGAGGTSNTGQITSNGGNGGDGNNSGDVGGGGGGAGGPNGDGTNGADGTGGIGGNGGGGNADSGGAGGTGGNGGDGSNGSDNNLGGGGGGGGDNSSIGGDGGFPGGGGGGGENGGGKGANGQIIISYPASLSVNSPADISSGTRAQYTISRNGPTAASATVNLSSSGPSGGQFFASSSGGSAITSVSIPAGSTSAIVFFTGNGGTHTVNFTSEGYLPASDELIISQPASTVTIRSGVPTTYTYRGSSQGPGINDFDFTGSAGTRSILYTGTGATSYNSVTPPIDAGTYQVVASVAADANFSSGSSLPFDFAITPANITITPDAGQFKIVGNPEPVLSYQSSGWVGSDNASILQGFLARNPGEEIGFYPINLGSITVNSANYTLSFISGISFEIRGFEATQYIVSVSTQNPKKGTSITVSAQLADVNGSAIPESGREVTWTELSGVTGSFGASKSVTDASGIATVQFTVSNQVGVSTAITASGSGELFGTSPIVTTVDSAPTQLVFLQAPSGTTEAGQPFAQQPIIEIQDADGNRVESATTLVFLSLASGTGELRGEIELQAVNGLASFAGLNIDLVGEGKAILAEADGLTSARSNPFSISAGPAALFTRYAGIQQVAAIGTAVTTPPAVRVQDIFGNPISGISVSFEVTSGGGSIQPTTAVLTDSEGIASLISWTLGPNAGSNIVVASSSGFTSLTFTALGSEDAIEEFNSSTTWTVPAGVTEITVEAWGGGGAGGGVTGARGVGRGGAGGGGGAYAKKVLNVTPGQTLQLRVGTGGSGAVASNGGNGGDSFISDFEMQFLAKGGLGGGRNVSTGTVSGASGGSSELSIGDQVFSGGNGGDGISGSFIPTGAGGQGANNGGLGGESFSSGTENGNPGSAPGGGGSGGRVSASTNSTAGGAGGSGKIIITYPKPVNQFRAASSGNWEDNATWEQQFSNGQFAKIDSKPSSNSTVLIAGETIKVTISDDLALTGNVIINSLGELSLASGKNLSLNSGATLTLGNEGILSLPADGFIQGAGNVAINKGGTLAIAHPDGIKASGASGAIQNSGTRSFSPEANYLYNGFQPQTVGDGLPPVVNSLIIDNISGVTLDRPLEVTLDLVMNAGALELDQSLMVDLGMTLNGSSQVVVKEGVSFTADLLSNLTTNQTSRIVLQPGAKYSNLGVSSPRLEVQQLLTGVKGWRMLGSPVMGATYLNFLSGLESQGFTGSTNPGLQPNVLWWDETDGGTTLQGWRQPANISQEVPNGRGHYVYVFNGGSKASGGNYSDNLPLTLSALGTEFNLNTGGFDFGVTYTPRNENFKGDAQSGTYTQVATANEGFNLIANPTASFIDFFNEAGWTKDKIDETIYIWDQNFNNGQGDFLEITADTPQAERLIAPYQGFWVRTSQENPSLVMNNEAKSFASSSFYGRIVNEQPASQASKIKLSVQGEGLKANASLRISDQGEDEIDPWDAFQLESLNSTWLNLYSLGSPQQTDPLVINHLSLPEQGEKTVPLYLAAAKEGKPFSGTYTLNWELPAEWPNETRVVLMDHISQKAIDMSQIQSYEFSFEAPTSTNMRIRTEEGGMKQPQAVVFSHEVVDGQGENFRTNSGQITRPFTIVIGYTGEGANPEYRPEQPKLYAPSPNPFVDRTQIKFYLPVEDSATVKIYDLKGQEVGSFEQQVYPAGIHTLDWEPNAIRLPKGVYLIHVVTSDQVLIQKALKF